MLALLSTLQPSPDRRLVAGSWSQVDAATSRGVSISAGLSAGSERKRWCDLGGKSGHLVHHLTMRLHSYIEIENHLIEARCFDLFEDVDDLLRRTQYHGVFGQVRRLHVLQPLYHTDEVAIAWRCGLWVTGKGRNHAFPVVADLPRPLRGFLLPVIGKMREVAAYQALRRGTCLGAARVIQVCNLL